MPVGGGTKAELRWANDRAIMISFGDAADGHALVRAFVRAIASPGLPAVVDIHPAYSSVLVVIDPLHRDADGIEPRLRQLVGTLRVEGLPAPRRLSIPIAYGGEFGPDLDDVARLLGIQASEIVRRHANAVYTVSFLGFVPGFAYLSGLDPSLRVPRLPAPRRRVPPGSLGIAAGQTAIYPLATPGGWRLIGRSPLPVFRADRQPPALLGVGDEISFHPIDTVEFKRLARESST